MTPQEFAEKLALELNTGCSEENEAKYIITRGGVSRFDVRLATPAILKHLQEYERSQWHDASKELPTHDNTVLIANDKDISLGEYWEQRSRYDRPAGWCTLEFNGEVLYWRELLSIAPEVK